MAKEQKGQDREAVEALEKGAELAERDSFAIAALGNALRLRWQDRRGQGDPRGVEGAAGKGLFIALLDIPCPPGARRNRPSARLSETGSEERAAYMNAIGVYYHFDPVRGHPRFQDIVRKMNLPERTSA